jgi:hypothetical protein
MQEMKNVIVKIPQSYLDLVNQIFEIEKKMANIKEDHSIQRNINKINGLLENGFLKDASLTYWNPIGESYAETRTDCEATIAGSQVDALEIVEVIKPIIFYSYKEKEKVIKNIVQRAIVIVQTKNTNNKED